MKKVVANNFNELMEHVLAVPDFPIYRGLQNSDYPLIPRLGRADKAELARSFGNSFREVEKTAVNQFKSGAPPHLEHVPSNEWEWLCVMQHHGTPTRLMDWTMSPLVATFFALRDARTQKPKTPAVVYGYKSPDDLLDIRVGINPIDHKRVEFFPAPHISNRVIAQQSYFSFHPSPEIAFAPEDLLQITIPPEAQEKIAYTVERLGFRETTMFPGLDSINDGIRKGLKI